MKNFIYILILFIAGCGFHLRGTVSIPKSLRTLAVYPNNPYEPFQRELRSKLENKNVKILPANTKNIASLHISEPTFSEQVIAIGDNNQPGQLRLYINVTYSLYDKNEKLIQGPTTVTSSKDFSVNPNDILGADTEREAIKNELRSNATSNILRKISKAYKNKK